MRRADRLFEIIQIFRRRGSKNQGPVTARYLAEELEVTERTVYRDIAALQSRRVPIEGEAGVGYMLRDGFDLPPLMFSEDELEALLLGARIVETHGDPALSKAAGNLLAKIEAVVPEALKAVLTTQALAAPASPYKSSMTIDMAVVRQSIRAKTKLKLDYRDEKGAASERTIWPLALLYWGTVWTILGWCELRKDFRAFRPDRIEALEETGDAYPDKPGYRLIDYLKREGYD